jgi:hypothetical protein
VRARRPCLGVALGLWVASLAGCMLPGAMAKADRLPACPGAECHVVAADLVGSFESVEIRGVAAASVLRVTYCFEACGRYTAEAMLVFADGPETRQITGTWELVSGRLHLGHGSEAADVRLDGDHLVLATGLGTVILKRLD